jgi:serine-type D-Ala-D-Ala carboxypeptidase/endopeptidase (penicillin-binding protein 4)
VISSGCRSGRRKLLRSHRGLALATLLVTVTACAPAGASDGQNTTLPAPMAVIMAKPQYANAAWGLRELDSAGAVVNSYRADEMFIPGSTTKLFSISSAWKRLGAGHRFTTPAYALGSRKRGVLRGNLVLVGVGDLSLGGRTTSDGGVAWRNVDHSDAEIFPRSAQLTRRNPLAGIEQLARQVSRSGIERVRGDVVVDNRLFEASFDPRPTPVMINDNLVDLIVKPTKAGRRAKVSHRPRAATLEVEAKVRTVAAGKPSSVSVSGQAPGRIEITGTIAAGSGRMIQIAPIAGPGAFARAALIQALRRAGVRVDAATGGPNPAAKLPSRQSYPRRSRVAAYVSPPYADYAKLILKVSHNLGANLSVCLLAADLGQRDCDAGFGPMRSFLAGAGVDVSQLAFSDGRGGDPADRATPTAVTQLLRYWIGQPDFDAFRQSLPILGVDGSLADVAASGPARGKVFAKTGTAAAVDRLNDRLVIQSKALAGYIEQPDGGWHVFSLVVNDAGGGPDLGPLLAVAEDLGDIATLLWQRANP